MTTQSRSRGKASSFSGRGTKRPAIPPKPPTMAMTPFSPLNSARKGGRSKAGGSFSGSILRSAYTLDTVNFTPYLLLTVRSRSDATTSAVVRVPAAPGVPNPCPPCRDRHVNLTPTRPLPRPQRTRNLVVIVHMAYMVGIAYLCSLEHVYAANVDNRSGYPTVASITRRPATGSGTQ
jgi:hypothetical protein